MRRSSLIAVLVVLLLFVGPALAGKGKGTDYGAGLTGKKTIKISKLLADPDPHVGETVRVKGVVTGVCERRGCWMSLASDEEFEELRIKVDDGVIVFPMSAKGKRAIAEGVFTKIEMSLDQTIAYKRHHAQEHGESFDPASVTEPMTYFQVKATGARVYSTTVARRSSADTMARDASGNRPRIRWRYWNKVIHRDVGYLCVALTAIYAISGIAVNHIHHWNPNYTIERVERRFEPVPVSDRETMTAQLVERLGLESPPDESFRPSPERVHLFYDGWSVEADAAAGTAIVERPRDRPLLRDMNFLHLNHPKGVWTAVADVYGALLLALAVSGLFMLKGRAGLAGRGKWFVGVGVLVPIVFIVVLRYLG